MNSVVAPNSDAGAIFNHIQISDGGDQCLLYVGESRGIPFEYYMINQPNEVVTNVIDVRNKVFLP